MLLQRACSMCLFNQDYTLRTILIEKTHTDRAITKTHMHLGFNFGPSLDIIG